MAGSHPVGRFGASSRVRKRRDFEEVQEKGRRVTTPHFVLLLYARGDSAGARLGIVASRKIGTAVVRNRAKRLVREAFRATRDLWTPGIDVVVIARRPLFKLKLDDIAAEWRQVASFVETRTRDAKRDGARRHATAARTEAP